MHQSHVARACVAFVLSLNFCLASAAERSLRLEDAVIRALERNPDLAAFGYELKVQQASAAKCSVRWPPWSLAESCPRRC